MTTTITLRHATRADLGVVDALLARSYPKLLRPDYPPSVMVTALPIIARARPALLASGTYWIAEAGERAVGAGGWTPSRSSGADLRHVVTDPAHVRQGIGRAILSRIFAEAANSGVRRFDCLATRTAVPFYKAMGFREIGPRMIELREGISFPAIAMQRRL